MDYNELLDKYNRLESDFMELVMKSEDICHYCKNNIECKGKDCEKYIEGRGCWEDKRCHHDWAWSCKDFDFGTCDMLENTPCNGCFKNNNKCHPPPCTEVACFPVGVYVRSSREVFCRHFSTEVLG